MSNVLNYIISYNIDGTGEHKELIIFSHKHMLETYLNILNYMNVNSLSVFKAYRNKPNEDYTKKLNCFIGYGKFLKGANNT